jgi:aspartate-semialdehyde dehydrogenase
MIKNEPVIAIVGATGLVGQEMVNIINESASEINAKEVRLLASRDSKGEVYEVCGQEVCVEELDENSFEGVDVALFATGADLSKHYVPLALEKGAIAIDNSSYFRMRKEVPLVVPEVNFSSVLKSESRLIANPNCSTIQMVPVLQILHQLAGLKRVVVSTYQSVSGAGKDALDELWSQTRDIMNMKGISNEVFSHQIAFNTIPQIDLFDDDGYTREEKKVINETRKILALPNLRITATAVRVPVLHSHAESVNIELDREVDTQEVIKALEKSESIKVYPLPEDYPMQINAAGDNLIHVGRIRRDESVPSGFNLWIVADNLRKGAALNAIQIMKELYISRQ